MRWTDLFADLEAQLAESDRQELMGQVADRTRRERAAVSWADRAATRIGLPVGLTTAIGPLTGVLQDLGSDWLLIEEDQRGSAVVPFGAVLSITGLGTRSEVGGHLGRRFGVGVALRAVARDRCAVAVHDNGGNVFTGTIDGVGSDHLQIAEHPADSIRRARALTGHRTVPFRAIAILRRC
ncbi:hypothetical protein V3G39_14900 [Dermatophilaceae bacterium Sec6.4]